MDEEPTGDRWRVDVTNADIRRAKLAWMAARDTAIPGEVRVAVLHDELARLISAQAQQIADDFRARRAG